MYSLFLPQKLNRKTRCLSHIPVLVQLLVYITKGYYLPVLVSLLDCIAKGRRDINVFVSGIIEDLQVKTHCLL